MNNEDSNIAGLGSNDDHASYSARSMGELKEIGKNLKESTRINMFSLGCTILIIIGIVLVQLFLAGSHAGLRVGLVGLGAGLGAASAVRAIYDLVRIRRRLRSLRRQDAAYYLVQFVELIEKRARALASNSIGPRAETTSLGEIFTNLAEAGTWNLEDVADYRSVLSLRNDIVHRNDVKSFSLQQLEKGLSETERLLDKFPTRGES